MNDIDLKLRTLVEDDASYELLILMLDLLEAREDKSHFDQGEPIELMSSGIENHDTLSSFVLRFNGLCELVSNCVIANDLMGSKNNTFRNKLAQLGKYDVELLPGDRTMKLILKTLTNVKSSYQEVITLDRLDSYTKTHILDVTSCFQSMLSYVFGIYPFDLFSYGDKVQIGKTVNQPLLKRKLDLLDDGTYIKFQAFKKTYFGFQGHSMVIKKTGDLFSFFDPNGGETFDLDLNGLCHQINSSMAGATHMSFLDGKKYIQSVMFEKNTLSPLSGQEEAQHSRLEITASDLILSGVKSIIEIASLDDETLIHEMDQLRTRIEQRLENHHEPSALSGITVIHQSDRYFRDQTEDKIDYFYNKRIKASQTLWKARLTQKPFDPQTYVSALQKNTSFYDFIAIANEALEKEKLPQPVCNMISNQLIERIKTTRDIQLFLMSAKGRNSSTELIEQVIKLKFPEIVKSAYDVAAVFKHLSVEQCTKTFEGRAKNLISMIKSAGDLGDIFKYFSLDQRNNMFEAIKDDLTNIIQSSDDSLYDFQQALNVLLPDQQAILLDLMMKKPLESIQIGNGFGTFISLYEHLSSSLSSEKSIVFGESMLKRLPEMVTRSSFKDLHKLSEKLPQEQWLLLCNEIKNKRLIPRAEKKDVFIDKSYLGIISQEKLKPLLESMSGHLPDFMLERIPVNYLPIVLDGRIAQLPTLIKSRVVNLTQVLNSFPYEQCAVLMREPDMQILAIECFKNYANHTKDPLFTALRFDNDEKIKNATDDLFRVIKQRYQPSVISLPYLNSKKIQETAHIRTVIEYFAKNLDNYWLQKLNIALKLDLKIDLNLRDSQLFITAFEQYAANILSASQTHIKDVVKNIQREGIMADESLKSPFNPKK